MITSPSDGVHPELAYFSVSCDICQREVERLEMRRGRMVVKDGQALTVSGEWYDIPANHYVVCADHDFDQATGEWLSVSETIARLRRIVKRLRSTTYSRVAELLAISREHPEVLDALQESADSA